MNQESTENQQRVRSPGQISSFNFQAPVPLRAGPLRLRYEAGDLRYIKLGEREVIRRIYAAVRDRNWVTVPGVLSDLRAEISDDSFRITYTSEHRQNEIHFEWRSEIVGQSDGTIQFTFDGEAHTDFLRNRIGFCVLHPIRECAGARCAAISADGARKELAFPAFVARDQPIPGLDDLAGLEHEIEPGVRAELRFEGDLFEMEDQRNWIDASFKTFCTPLRLPFPAEVKAGTKVRQTVTLRCFEEPGTGRIPGGRLEKARRETELRPGPVTLQIGTETWPVPPIGLGLASHRRPLSATEVERLRSLAPGHLRADLLFNEESWRETLMTGLREAEMLGCQLELALHLSGLPSDDLKDLAEALTRSRFRSFEFMRRAKAFRRLIIFTQGEEATSLNSLKAARRFVREFGLQAGEAAVGGGSNADFYELARFKPEPGLVDFVSFSMNPQVHASDLTSLAETPEAVPATIASAREYFGGVPVVVSPITLKPRFNAVATGPEDALLPGDLPASVDPRQCSLFGAGWTLAMLKRLIEARVDSVTLYETTGWRGVMETELGSPVPEKFPSIPGSVFPLYHVLADVAELRSGEAFNVTSSDSLAIEALVFRAGNRLTALIANLRNESQHVQVCGVRGCARVRILDESNVTHAMTDPGAYRQQAGRVEEVTNGFSLQLGPFALARVDFSS